MDKRAVQANRDIFAISGLPPEVLAVAMAKYSRSKQSIRDTIDELTEEKSAEFHEKWVIGYGDASVADMAVIAIACENVSMIASKAIEDTRLASFQEKSTRYVDFDTSRYHRPANLTEHDAATYETAIQQLLATYDELLAPTIAYLRGRFQKPEDKSDTIYEAKLKARSLDAVRYLLPTATLTNFGMIMNARSLRHLISKLKGSDYLEVRELGEEIQKAALEPAYNPQAKKLQPHLDALVAMGEKGEALANELTKLSSLQVKGAPTLIKYTDPLPYYKRSKELLRTYADALTVNSVPDTVPRVDYIEPHSYEDELVTTLLYPETTLPYRQLLTLVQAMPKEEHAALLRSVANERGVHDQPKREYEVGGQFIFDTLMDYGAFRDLQRHRMTTQIHQPLTTTHGYEVPFELEEAGVVDRYHAMITMAFNTHAELKKRIGVDADYLLPLACKKRTLFKMNLRELYHMLELRSKPGGHMSYRSVVLDMYNLVKDRHPLLVEDLRIVIPDYDADFFKR